MVDLVLLHPKLVHFPIALIALAVFFELLFVWKKDPFYRRFSLWMVHLGFVSALAALATGFWAADAIGHDSPGHDHVHEHRDLIIAALSLWFLFIVAIRFVGWLREDKGSVSRIVIGIIISAVLYTGAHEGGELVFEYGVGVKVDKKNGEKSSEKNHKTEQHEHQHEHEH